MHSNFDGISFPRKEFSSQQSGLSIIAFNFIHSQQERIKANGIICHFETCLRKEIYYKPHQLTTWIRVADLVKNNIQINWSRFNYLSIKITRNNKKQNQTSYKHLISHCGLFLQWLWKTCRFNDKWFILIRLCMII